MITHSLTLRRLSALLTIPTVLLLSACGARYEMTVSKDDTADVTQVLWGEEVTEDYCSEEILSQTTAFGDEEGISYTFTEHDGDPACEVTMTDRPLSRFLNADGSSMLVHEDGEYHLHIPQEYTSPEGYTYQDLVVSATFPGKVTEASGDAEIDGNTVTWSEAMNETDDLDAVAKDSSGLPWLWIGIGAAVVLGGVAAVVTALALRSRKSKQAASFTYPGQPQPGYPGQQEYQPQQAAQQGYVPQGGYTPQQAQGYQGPQQAQAPTGYTSPSGYGQQSQQKYMPPQGYNPPQNPQAPYDPNGQY